jgi:hypothetical protein|tara:strand:- start:4616 stop:4894 length:279 start_codon:yes stop_codon:yes gene_type:complete
MIEILRKAADYSQEPISKDQFHGWKNDPVTRELFQELTLSMVDQLSDDLPEDSIDRNLISANQREGARKMLEILFEWEPRTVKAIREGDGDD